MTEAELTCYYPRLFHMAEVQSWPSIRKHGLLSTSALLDLFEIAGGQRLAIEFKHRPQSVTISHGRHGSAVIRDQKPLRPKSLAGCLTDLTPTQWYGVLNQRVFFWLTKERLLRLLSARAYRKFSHCVITVDTAKLLRRQSKDVVLSSINSGSTIYTPQKRGSDTFQRIDSYPFDYWKRKRGTATAVAELAVNHSVPRIEDIALEVAVMRRGKVLRRLWRK